MNKEEFVAIGIDEKLAEKAAEQSKKELSNYVPKERFDEVNEAKKQLEESSKEHETQMEALKQAAGDNEGLKKQISELQEQNKRKDTEYEEKLKDLRITNAIKLAVSGSAQDSDLVAGLIDKGKLILGEDGIVTGLDEQVKALKEKKAFLFKDQKEPQVESKQGIRVGAIQKGESGEKQNGSFSMKDAIAARIQTQTGQGKE